MRFIDEVIKFVRDHDSFSEVHKQVIITRLEKNPTDEELVEAREVLRNKEVS